VRIIHAAQTTKERPGAVGSKSASSGSLGDDTGQNHFNIQDGSFISYREKRREGPCGSVTKGGGALEVMLNEQGKTPNDIQVKESSLYCQSWQFGSTVLRFEAKKLRRQKGRKNLESTRV